MIWYDQLPLLLVAERRRQRLALVVTGWAGYLGWRWAGDLESRHIVDDSVAQWVLAACYLLALAVVFWQQRVALGTAVRWMRISREA